MPKICVEIEIGDDGAVRVGAQPYEEGAETAEKPYLQPARSVEDALGTAKDLLSGSTGEQAQAAQAEGDFRQGFSGARPMGATPAQGPTRMQGA